MCVLIDVALNGLFLTSTSSPLPNPVLATKGAMFEKKHFKCKKRANMIVVQRAIFVKRCFT